MQQTERIMDHLFSESSMIITSVQESDIILYSMSCLRLPYGQSELIPNSEAYMRRSTSAREEKEYYER